MKNKRYIIKKGKALISFSDVDKAARMNNIREWELRSVVRQMIKRTCCGWSLCYVGEK